MSNKKYKEEARENIRVLVIRGYTDVSISKKLGIPRTTINHYSKKIRTELEMRPDIINDFDYKFHKLELSFNMRKESLNEDLEQLEAETKKNWGAILECKKQLHTIDVDEWKLLNDSDIVLAVRRLKNERFANQQPERIREIGTPLIRG